MIKDTSKKFTIIARLEQLPRQDSIIMRKVIERLLSKSRQQTSKILNTTADSTLELPGYIVLQLAEYFGCDPKEIYTTPPRKITQEQLNSAASSGIAKGLGLVK